MQSVPDPSAGGTINLEDAGGDKKRARGKGKRTAENVDGAPPAPRRRRKKITDPAVVGSVMEDVRMETGPRGRRMDEMDTEPEDGGGTNTGGEGTDDDDGERRHRGRMLEEDDGDYEEH